MNVNHTGEADLGEMVRYYAIALTALVLAAHHPKPHAPAWFVKQAACVHHYEAGAWRWTPTYHPGYTYWNQYWTGLQFDIGTWNTANQLLHHYTDPHTGNSRVIILHAYAIVKKDGGSWREWPNTARACGLPTY